MTYQKSLEICPVCKERAGFKFIQDYMNKGRVFSFNECSKCEVHFGLFIKKREF